MGADIFKEYESARAVMDECEDALGISLKRLMFEGPQHELTSTENAQPAILCHSIALLRVLESELGFDVGSCTYTLGHSLGEYSALTSEKQTAMRALVINGDHLEDIEALMSKVAEIANINSRSQVVLSGRQKMKGFAGRSVGLPVSAPFHCSLMSPAGEHMRKALEQIEFKEPIIDVISNVTGRPFNSRTDIGHLLEQQVTKTVQWHRSIRFARDEDVNEWIVVGPSRVLSNLLKKEYPLDVIKSVSTTTDLKMFKRTT
ncbi:acyl transferase/acyl hydrolase/lysophospholipase [Chytridium lagenaria]|nr:acyl transferase/acyl hydrolase/lysophospholipase [Chytridium lagenaria]